MYVGGVKIKVPGSALDRVVPKVRPKQVKHQRADAAHGGECGEGLKSPQIGAAQSGQKLATPEDQAIGEQGRAAGFESAGVTAAAGTLGALAAPSVAAARVGTGLLNPAGEEILKDVTQYGPSLLRQALSNPVTQHILAKVVGYGTLGYILRRTFSGQP